MFKLVKDKVTTLSTHEKDKAANMRKFQLLILFHLSYLCKQCVTILTNVYLLCATPLDRAVSLERINIV